MGYLPIRYFNASPQIKLAIPQEAWYHEFMTPSIGGNPVFDGVASSANINIDRFFLKTGYDLSGVFRYAPLNTMVELLRVTEDEGFSFMIVSHYSNDIRGEFSINSCNGNMYWTNFKTGISNQTGNFVCYYSNTYSTGEEIKIPTYITCLISNDEKKCFLNMTNWTTDASNRYDIFSQCPLNGPYLSHYLTETTLYPKVVGNETLYDDDPWSNAGYGETGGGDGTFDFTSDNIHLPQMPESNAVNTGFVQLFKGTIAEIRALASYMWTNTFWDAIVKLTANPMDVILSLSIFPFNIPASNRRVVEAGNVVTPVTMAVPDNQIIEIDCGNYNVPKFYGSYLDYEPFAKCEIFLPYCGMKTLSLDDIVGRTVNVKYRVDLLTGSCAVFVLVNETVLYTFSGVCASNIPVTSRGFENTINAILNIASAGVTAFTGTGSASMIAGFGASVASNVMQSKPTISRSGNLSGNSGFFGVQKPYLIFTVPRVAIPKGQATYQGYPIFSTYKLSDLTGYTEIEEIHLENMGRATSDEIAKIENLLKEGVIL